MGGRAIDLSMTFYPSFISPLFEAREGWYVKVFGFKRGSRFRAVGGRLLQVGCREEAPYWSGFWFRPRKMRRHEVFNAVVEEYGRLSLAVDPWDRGAVFVLAFLSRNTDFHRNVVRWWRTLAGRSETVEGFSGLEHGLRSYQVLQLGDALRGFLEVGEERDPWEMRKKLLGIRNVGPKVADAFLLFTGFPQFTPADVHYRRFVEKLGLLRFSLEPRKSLCSKYACRECPESGSCLTGVSIGEFGEMSGWLQTISYYHGKNLCGRGLCGACGLREFCLRARAG